MPLSSKSLRLSAYVFVVAFTLIALACSGSKSSGGTVKLQGAGATFPNPLYQKWIHEFSAANANVQIDYQSIGSGGGIKQLQAQTVDFGASDAPMTDDELKASPAAVVHIPTVLGAVVVTYNLSGISTALRFSPDVVAGIFLGKITKWNDARIKADNPDANLPAADISSVHRAESSGTTFVFTDYLSKVSAEWKDKVGANKSPKWIGGIGGKGNEGVTGQVKQTPNTIGYVELAYAVQNKLPVALIKNKAGNFVEPTIDAVTAAAAGSIARTPDDLRVSITNADGATAYPISSYTYILAYQDQKDATKGKAVVDFLWWGIHDGQKFAKDLQYAPLPDEIVKRTEAKINSLASGGKPLR